MVPLVCKFYNWLYFNWLNLPLPRVKRLFVCNSNSFFSNFCPYFAATDENP